MHTYPTVQQLICHVTSVREHLLKTLAIEGLVAVPAMAGVPPVEEAAAPVGNWKSSGCIYHSEYWGSICLRGHSVST